MTYSSFNAQFFDFIQNSPTSFHAAETFSQLLISAGFKQIYENQIWKLSSGQGYFVIRDNGGLIAFTTGSDYPKVQENTQISFLGAHTDSPGLKIKPQPDSHAAGWQKLGIEVYGGPILSTWFDRELGIAGRINWLDENDQLQTTLFDTKQPVVYIPSLAIHLDRKPNEAGGINAQTSLPLLFSQSQTCDTDTFPCWLKDQARVENPTIKDILSHDLYCYDPAKPQYLGREEEFFSCPRLDNLASCFIGIKAIEKAIDAHKPSFLVLNDHEEVGSTSLSGAAGSFAMDVFKRIYTGSEERQIIKSNSLFISMDNAHATHPNFVNKSDPDHPVRLNGGVVIKNNSKLRYATNSLASASFKILCQQTDTPYQEFVMRSDMPCGSTIGPITSSLFGITTIDIGIPTLGMHSIRELTGCKDLYSLFTVARQFVHQSD